MKVRLTYSAVVAIVALLLFSGIAFGRGFGSEEAPPARSNSVRITVGDGPLITNVAEGDVLYDGAERGSRSNGGYGEDTGCNIPGVSIRISGDVRKVRVGLKEGTCDLIVEDITMNNTVLTPPEDAGPPGSAFPTGFNTQAGWEWYVESLSKMVGINSIDDLTKTYARFNFKTANFTGGGPVYDGHDDGG